MQKEATSIMGIPLKTKFEKHACAKNNLYLKCKIGNARSMLVLKWEIVSWNKFLTFLKAKILTHSNRPRILALFKIEDVFKIYTTSMLFCRSLQGHNNILVLNVAERSEKYHGYSSINKPEHLASCRMLMFFMKFC